MNKLTLEVVTLDRFLVCLFLVYWVLKSNRISGSGFCSPWNNFGYIFWAKVQIHLIIQYKNNIVINWYTIDQWQKNCKTIYWWFKHYFDVARITTSGPIYRISGSSPDFWKYCPKLSKNSVRNIFQSFNQTLYTCAKIFHN